MPRSSRHKSHKQSKHSSRDYSDSEEDVVKMKEKSSKDDNSIRVHRDSASGEKRKSSSQVREGKDSKDLNGDVLEELVSSKRRKEKTDIVGGDRWNGGDDSDRKVEKEMYKGESLKVDTKLKESIRIESKNKSKRYESGIASERKEDKEVVLDKEESKSKGESRRKSERDSSARKEGRESKDKDRRWDKEKNGGQDSKSGDGEAKLADMDIGKKQGSQLGELSEERQGKRSRENADRTLQDDLRNPELEKETEKRIRRKREVSSEREKNYEDSKEGDDRRSSSKGDRSKDVKYRDDKYKDGGYADKYQEDSHKDDRRRDEKYREDVDRDYKHQDDKYRDDGEKDARRRDDRHREDGGDRESRRKDEKHRDDGERDSRRKDERYREGIDREGRRDDKYHEDGDRDNRRKDDRYHEDGEKDTRRGDERYHEDGDRDDRRRDYSYRDDGDRDNRHREEKYREDAEREKRPRDIKYRDERTSRDRSGDKSDPKRSRDDGYGVDHHGRKSSAYDDSPTHDDRTARYRDDQGRRRTNEKEEYGDVKSRGTKDHRSDADKKSASSSRMDPSTDRVRSTSRTADVELPSSQSRRRSSPTSGSHAPRDHYRALKQDDTKYRDYNYEERVRHSRDYAGAVGGSDKTSSRSVDKLVDKSPSSSTDRRHLSRPDVRRSVDVEESTQRSGGSRDWKEYSGKEGRGSRELGMDVPPGEEPLQADTDTLSVSSPFARNSQYSSSSKSLPPPPPFRTGVDSPSMLGSAEDDGRGKLNNRHRRIGDPNMGRIQGNAWRGVPNWPSPVPNGFLPFPHGPPPVGFHSVMQPFPAPPMFGVRPSMELNHPTPFHMPDPDRFSGPGRPMGWRNQVDDSCPPMHAWDASNAVFGDESHMYGRSDWDHSRNLPGSRGWEPSGDLWKAPNRTASMEMLSSEKENNSIRSGDEALTGQLIQPAQNEQTRIDQRADSADISLSVKSSERNDIEASLVSPENAGHVAEMSRKDDVRLSHVYLSKLDISAELTEPELFYKCIGLIDMGQSISSDADDSKILFMEDLEARMASHSLLSYTLFAPTDDSVFQKSMALYERQKENIWAEKRKVLNDLIPNSDQKDENAEDNKTETMCPTDNVQGAEHALPNSDTEAEPKNSLEKGEGRAETSQQKIDQLLGNVSGKSGEPVSTLDNVQMDVAEEKPLPVESVEQSDTPLPSEAKEDAPVESASNNEEMKSVDTKCGPLVNSDVSSEAMMPESVVPGSVNSSRIHHSPESTH
ncbi:hypothetical protein CDL12_25741 [Handroanthus impetiginosus]|uniref:Uncharacterized protein n=1 Tax=Handroanthus impetiginosus TaxID=429701 RepID=A0A2G9G8Z8_9LAMI|nr:hypothetical protein CDL12_25741 [Handroanthus impetiginosus]